MSSKVKNNIYYVRVLVKDVEQSTMISQLRILDTKRLASKIGYISKDDFMNVQSAVMDIIKPIN